MKVYNLADDRELQFDPDTDPTWGVAYAYCEESNRLDWLFDNLYAYTLAAAYAQLPIVIGMTSVACGNWATPQGGSGAAPIN